MLTIFVLWSNFTLHYREDPDEWQMVLGSLFETILIILCCFFLLIEIVKFIGQPTKYGFNIWNWLGLPPLILVLINASRANTDAITTNGFWQS